MYSDKLGEKIIANYQLIGMEITSADLLHMMVQEPELFLNAESFSIMTIESPVYTANQIKLEMINQLVNRLMLYLSPEFTYQDEVFVVSVLQKLGISDVKEFMQQIHRHMDHNLLFAKLFYAYHSQQKKIAETVHLVQARLQQSYQETKEIDLQNVWDKDYKFSYYLHNEVFERLMTAECNHIIYAYYCQMDKRKTTVQGVREAAWAKQADVIQLLQMRKRMFEQINPVAWQEDLYYERKHFAQRSLTEETVVQRIVAAILENMIQGLHGVWLREKNVGSSILWKDYTQTFCRSAADVLERFWYFQKKQTIAMQRYEAYLDKTYILTQNEWKLTQLLDHLDLFYNHTDKEQAESEVVLSIWENQNLQKQLMGRIQLEERLAVQDDLRDIDLQEEQEYQAELYFFQKIRSQWTALKQQIQNKNLSLAENQGQSSAYISSEIQNNLDQLTNQELQNSINIVSDQELQNRVDLSTNQEVRNNLNMQLNQEVRHNLDMQLNQELRDNLNMQLNQEVRNKLDMQLNQEVGNNLDIQLSQEVHNSLDMQLNQELSQEIYNNLDMLQQRKTQKYFARDLGINWKDNLPVLHHYAVPFGKQRQHIAVEGLPQIGIKNTNHKFHFYFDKIQEDLQRQGINRQESNTSLELLYRKQNEDKVSPESLQNQQKSHYNYMEEFLQKYAEFVSQQEVPFSENKRLLDKINQHNLQMKHRLKKEDNTFTNKNTIRRVVVDQKKARQSALRALENPQEALREIDIYATPIEGALPPELERILRITDENTQLFYRQLLGYQNISSQKEQNSIQDNNIFNNIIDTIKKEQELNKLKSKEQELNKLKSKEQELNKLKLKEQEPNKLKLKEQSSENNTANLENIKTRIQFNTYSSEVDNINGPSSFNNIERTLKQIEEREHKIFLESIVQRYTDVPQRLYLDHQSVINDKVNTEHRELQESQRLLRDKEFLRDTVLLENKQFLQDKEWLETVVSIKNVSLKNQEWKEIDFAHKPEFQLTAYLEDLENRKLASSDQIPQKKEFQTEVQTELEQLKQQQQKQRQLVQQQLQDIQQKLLRETEEQFTQMVNHSLKTQVHAISDIVYHELERRLKNEQRRRGY